MSEFARIARSILLLKDFSPVKKNLLDRMISQGSSKNMLLKQIKKALIRHPENVKNFDFGLWELTVHSQDNGQFLDNYFNVYGL